MARFWNSFKTILWKIYVFRKRHWAATIILEIGSVCLMMGILLYIRLSFSFKDDTHYNATITKVQPEADIDECFSSPASFIESYNIAYSPNSSKLVNDIMTNVKEKIWKTNNSTDIHSFFRPKSLKNFLPMKSEKEVENYFSQQMENDSMSFGYGIIFDTSNEKEFSYKIRPSFSSWDTETTFPLIPPDGPGFENSKYFSNCFITVQKAIDEAFIKIKSGKDIPYQVNFQQFPYPAYVGMDYVRTFVQQVLPKLIMLSYSFIFPFIIKRVVQEKETGVRELMKMMGLRPWMIWGGWFLNAVIVNLFSATVITVVLCGQFKAEVSALLPFSNPMILWLLLMVYSSCVTVFLFVFCAFFSKSMVASSVGLFSYIVLLNGVSYLDQIKAVQHFRSLLLIFPMFGFDQGMNIIFAFESRGIGVHFSNFFDTSSDQSRSICMGTVFLMMLVGLVIFSCITWYFDCVRPGQYGRAKPWYFIFEFWKKKKSIRNVPLLPDNSDSKYFESPSNGNIGISVRDLTKVFPPNVHAVNGVNIDIYKGQITALLGHNGAGKTTTMSILTGMYSPTTGSMHYHISDSKVINVYDDLEIFRDKLGLCPQTNMHCSYFTVLEHLIFFGMLKGLTASEARKQGLEHLKFLNIADKANSLADKLSGGMKRKLSLAIALIGDPSVLMLDEPTSGLDPESRRELWDVLLSLRHNRTIIITTHFMEEADVLGDRIAIMDHGVIKCYGSSIFLKKAYGTGYNLTLLVNPDCEVDKISDAVTKTVPGSKLKIVHDNQLIYSLPSESTAHFPKLFDRLESSKEALRISSIGISCTTLEEVFLKVGQLAEEEGSTEIDKRSNNSRENTYKQSRSTEHLSPHKVSGIRLILQQFIYLFLKRVRYTFRRVWLTVYYMFIAIFMTFLAVYFVGVMNKSSLQSHPSIKLNTQLYEDSEILVAYTNERAEQEYAALAKNSKVIEFQNANISAELLNVGNTNIVRYRHKLIVAANLDKTEFTSLYSSIASHSSPVSLNLITNTVLRLMGGSGDVTISTYNHPFPKFSQSMCNSEAAPFMAAFIWLIFIPLGVLYLLANFITFPLEERVNSAKHLQFMTGTSPITYWVATYIWDVFIFFVMSLLLILPVYQFDSFGIYSGAKEIGVLLLILNLYAVSGIAYAYFFSFLKKTAAGAASHFVFLNLLITIIATIAVEVLDKFEILKGVFLSIVKGLLNLNPQYCLSAAVFDFSVTAYQNSQCEICSKDYPELMSACPDKLPYIATDPENKFGILEYVWFLAFDWIFYFALIMLIEYGIVGMIYSNILYLIYGKVDVDEVDADVQEEKDKVDSVINSRDDSPLMVVNGLMKKYGRRFPAVQDVSFQVPSGECFGLLGVNGAGKTTTFKMLTGEVVPTSGNATILNYSLRRNKYKFLSQIGYCPQFDGINELMTGNEMLVLFGVLRGYTPSQAQKHATYWIKFLGLEEYSNRQCGTYSGGNKRKLSTAMALIGEPLIVFLDEPTSGVDPVARRKLWDVLARCQESGQSIILTSHSMDECEALCKRLTIMAKGRMMCIGSIQKLKEKFGQGYTIMVKLHSVQYSDAALTQLKRAIESIFAPHCVLKDEHKVLLHYHITDVKATWLKLFSSMEKIKKDHSIVEDYTVSETTLEQVFLSFAKQQ